VVTVAAFAYLGWANTLPPPEPTNWVVPQPNGYDRCLVVLQKLSAVVGPNVANAWSSPVADVRRELRPAVEGLKELRVAMRLPYRAPEENPADSSQDGYYFRWGGRLLGAEARLAFADGKVGAAMRSALDAVEFGCIIGQRGSVSVRFSGQTLTSTGRDTVSRCLPLLTAAEARTSGQRLERLIETVPTGAEWMDVERRSALASLRYVFAEGLKAPAVTHESWQYSLGAARYQATLALSPKPSIYRGVDAYYRACEREFEKPFPQRRFPAAPRDWISQLDTEGRDRTSRYLALELAGLRMLRVELALQEFRQRRRRYPVDLAELQREVSMAPQLDPFTELPFGYRRMGDDYLLYSMGPDGVDDGGRRLSGELSDPGVKGDLPASRRRGSTK